MPTPTVYRTQLSGLERIHEGKVRDIYAIDAATMLIVTTDRLSAFDVVLPDPIPDKGRVLNSISNFWFERTRALVPNHLTGRDPLELARNDAERALLGGRSVVVRRLQALPIEAVVRGYLIGSGWKDYQASGALCGIALPAGPQAGAAAAAAAVHARQQGRGRRARREHRLRRGGEAGGRGPCRQGARYGAGAVRLRRRACARARHHHRRHQVRVRRRRGRHAHAHGRGGDAGLLALLARRLPTAWAASPPSFDKQFVRDYLETLDWNKQAPGPQLPPQVIARTSEKYREALARLTGAAG